MPDTRHGISDKQAVFRDMFVGVMIYSVVIGFFNDYTHILHTGTYSTTFALAIVMQLLTYLTFAVKDRIVQWFQKRQETKYSIGLIASVWLVIFLSKFVFLWVISIVFSEDVEISGFFGLLIIIMCMTVAERLIKVIDDRLAD